MVHEKFAISQVATRMAKWWKKKCFHNLHIALARMYLPTYLPADGSLLHFFQWEWISPWRRQRKVVWKTNSARPGKNWVMCREKFVNRLRYFKFSVSSRGTPRSMPSRTSEVSRGAEWDSLSESRIVGRCTGPEWEWANGREFRARKSDVSK